MRLGLEHARRAFKIDRPCKRCGTPTRGGMRPLGRTRHAPLCLPCWQSALAAFARAFQATKAGQTWDTARADLEQVAEVARHA